MNQVNAMALVLCAAFLPICELAVSFSRRIWGRKSPFRGDKLHLHYVLKNRYQFTASQASTRMGLGSAIIMSVGYLVSHSYNPIAGLCFISLVTLQTYLMVCAKEWRSSYLEEPAENIFKLFEGKKITIIDSTKLGTLDITVQDAKINEKKKSA